MKNQSKIPQKNNVISVFRMYNYGRYKGLAPYIFAQAYHETGNFSSNIYLTRNNMFGMKIPSNRPYVGSKGYPGGYMKYNTLGQSIQDLLLWMDYTKFPSFVTDTNVYVRELKNRGYFEDTISNYYNGLERGLKLYNDIN